jgi:hypothetical protein
MCSERSCVPVPRADVAGNPCQERIEIERFEQILRECSRGGLHRRCVCGHEHDWHICQIMAAQLRHDVEPAQAGQMEIQQHNGADAAIGGIVLRNGLHVVTKPSETPIS